MTGRGSRTSMWYFVALCLLVVKAQNDTDSSPAKKDSKIEPKNISSLYIGDLLRTKPKEDDLEAAGSFHKPILLDQGLLSAAAGNPSLPYKSHGGHEYAEHGYPPEGRARVEKRTGVQAQNAPFHVKGHILTLKPVRVVSADNVPTPRNLEKSPRSAHYPGDDCSKSSDRSYSSEEKPYTPEKLTYRRAKQTAPDLEYRNPPPSSYYDDDRSEAYSSHSDPPAGSSKTYSANSGSKTYSSKSYPLNADSKSQSSGSYTTSKSTSSSKSVIPGRSKTMRVIPTAVSNEENYEKDNYGPGHGGQGLVVYKVNEPSNQKQSSYPETSEKEYLSPDYDREHKSAVREPHYSRHPSGVRKSQKPNRGTPTRYSSSEPKDRPQQYGPYDEDNGQHHRERNKPSSNYNENKYAHEYIEREPGTEPHHQNYPASPREPSFYNAEQKNKPHHNKKQLSTQYEKSSNRGREQSGYRTRGHSTPEYDQSREFQTSRGHEEIPQRKYKTYPSEYGPTEGASPAPQSYDRTQPAPRPSEKEFNQYGYEATPHQTNTKQSEVHSSHKRPYRESSRYVRSPEQPAPSVIVEGRAQLPALGNAPIVMISRESKPYVSQSESFSGSDYNAEGNERPKARYGLQTNEGRHMSNPHYQTSHKAFHSGYPASYANDANHNSAGKQRHRAYERPSAQSHDYNAPVYSQTDSHSEEAPHQPQTYQEQQAYDQEYDDGDSDEKGGRPVKKGKNHHYISNIEGYKDTYGKDEPLVIDEGFFRKYGISPTAKVIVANAENPNLFVADGTRVKEGEFFENSGPSSGPNYESSPDSGYGPSSAISEEENYDPGHKASYKEDSYSSSPEEVETTKQIPGSFDDLVDTNPKFLRHLPQLMKNEDVFFKMDSTEDSFEGVEFPRVGEQRGFVVSQAPGEIVQQHGDGVSRIVFNVPKVESISETRDKEIEGRIAEAASELIQNIIHSDS